MLWKCKVDPEAIDKKLYKIKNKKYKTKYKIKNTKNKIQNTKTKYKIQSTKYKVQSTKYKVQSTKYKIQNYAADIWKENIKNTRERAPSPLTEERNLEFLQISKYRGRLSN